jgi:hypothetical protein
MLESQRECDDGVGLVRCRGTERSDRHPHRQRARRHRSGENHGRGRRRGLGARRGIRRRWRFRNLVTAARTHGDIGSLDLYFESMQRTGAMARRHGEAQQVVRAVLGKDAVDTTLDVIGIRDREAAGVLGNSLQEIEIHRRDFVRQVHGSRGWAGSNQSSIRDAVRVDEMMAWVPAAFV